MGVIASHKQYMERCIREFMQIPFLIPAWPKPAAPLAPRVGSNWKRWLARGVLLGLCIAFVAEVVRVLFVGNVHTVVPGRVYRSGQLSAGDLRQFIQANGIRTVVNLRGHCPWMEWYQDESRTNHNLNVAQEDITLSANRLPAPSEIRRLIEVLDNTEYPIVMHCRQGADRTGLASAIYMLLLTNADYAVARRQCGPRYAHVPVLSTVNMDRFFDQYEEWLRNRSLAHAPEHFRRWALNDYRADPAPARIQLLGPVPVIETGEALTLKVRVENVSNAVWEFKPGTATATHLRYVVTRSGGQLIGTYRAGRFEARIAPGESIDLDMPFTPFAEPGDYRVIVDMADRQVSFGQLGSELLIFDIPVRARGER